MTRFTCDATNDVFRSLIGHGFELPGFGPISLQSNDHCEMSTAMRLIQYSWTRWDDPLDV